MKYNAAIPKGIKFLKKLFWDTELYMAYKSAIYN